MRSFVVCLALSIFFSPRIASACSCRPSPAVLDERDRSDAVFEVDLAPNHVGRVTRVWKGTVPAQITVALTDCPPTPDVGRWLVYGYEGGGVWHANMCGRSRRFPAAESDLDALGTPLGGPAEPPPPDPPVRASGDPMAGAALSGGPPPEPPRPSSCACRSAIGGASSDGTIAMALACALAIRARGTRNRTLL
jgi:hypothetical protein